MHLLDLGCGAGYFSRVLSLQFRTIGLDIKRRIKVRGRKLDFILADISLLPFRSHSVDIVVCVSVLEHLQDLNDVVGEIKNVLRRDGVFIVGYPIETDLFKFIWKRVSPFRFKFTDQSQTDWRNPYTGKQECYWESPLTHKQDYQTIRDMLRRHFKFLEKGKLPLNLLPDSLTFYECTKMRRTQSSR